MEKNWASTNRHRTQKILWVPKHERLLKGAFDAFGKVRGGARGQDAMDAALCFWFDCEGLARFAPSSARKAFRR